MGGYNLTHAHSNYLICMRFIRINTVLNLAKFVAHGRMNGEPYPPEMVFFLWLVCYRMFATECLLHAANMSSASRYYVVQNSLFGSTRNCTISVQMFN